MLYQFVATHEEVSETPSSEVYVNPIKFAEYVKTQFNTRNQPANEPSEFVEELLTLENLTAMQFGDEFDVFATTMYGNDDIIAYVHCVEIKS